MEPTASSLSFEDVFLLDSGDRLYVWPGAEAEGLLGFYAVSLAHAVNLKERNSEATVVDFTSAPKRDVFSCPPLLTLWFLRSYI